MKAARATIEFILKNFTTPIAFFVVFNIWGARPAIGVAVVFAVAQLVLHLVLRHVISPFFLAASFFTVLFGCLDFLSHEPRLFRLAPFTENAVIGSIFAVSVMLDKPIAQWFAKGLPARLRPDLGEGTEAYLRKLTWIWTAYFFAKAVLFLYLAFRVDLGQLIVLRSLIGGASLILMFGGELFYRKRIRSQ